MLSVWVPGCTELFLRVYNLTIPNEIEITIGDDKNVHGMPVTERIKIEFTKEIS